MYYDVPPPPVGWHVVGDRACNTSSLSRDGTRARTIGARSTARSWSMLHDGRGHFGIGLGVRVRRPHVLRQRAERRLARSSPCGSRGRRLAAGPVPEPGLGRAPDDRLPRRGRRPGTEPSRLAADGFLTRAGSGRPGSVDTLDRTAGAGREDVDGTAGADHRPARPARPHRRPARRAGQRDPRLPGPHLRPARRPPRPQPRRRRADPGDPPGLRLARATGSSSTPATRPTCTRSSPAAPTGSTRCARRAACPATRARRSPSTTSSRTPTPPPSLSYADGLAKAYAIRGEDRHVVAVIGDGALTGGMAWEALNNIAAGKDRTPGDRRQRQRPLLHADRRRPRQPPHRAAHQPALRAGARPGQAAASTASAASARRCTTPCTR